MPDGAYAYPAYKGHHLVLRRPDKAQPPSGKQTALTRALLTPTTPPPAQTAIRTLYSMPSSDAGL
ncbi:hypothetical protein CYD30_06825 [Kosakonia cowanii]|nr:hypothetical protein CYD30_06825 [Kosakonia cowanii]